jgi:type II secretory pathway pseudopilin PulG
MSNSHFLERQMLSWFTSRKQLLHLTQKKQSTDQGLTLIEGLIAIVIISITMVSITPPIFWAVATRVQTQRAEQALKIAQGEIDRVRVLIERNQVGTTQLSLLPPSVNGATETEVRKRSSSASDKFPAPTTAKAGAKMVSKRDCGSNSDDDNTPDTISKFIRIDADGDCKTDFLLQTFRSQGLDQAGNAFTGATGQNLAAFVMGVRVYSSVAEPALTGNKGKTEPGALRSTNGLGNQLDRPLAVLYSTVVRSSDSQNLELYRKLCPTASKTSGAC